MGEITRVGTLPPAAPGDVVSDELEALLYRALAFGAPRIHYISAGWYCAVEMNTTTAGSKFEVASDFKQPSPTAAVQQCLSRIADVMRSKGQ